jgi:hypothetical protein
MNGYDAPVEVRVEKEEKKRKKYQTNAKTPHNVVRQFLLEKHQAKTLKGLSLSSINEEVIKNATKERKFTFGTVTKMLQDEGDLKEILKGFAFCKDGTNSREAYFYELGQHLCTGCKQKAPELKCSKMNCHECCFSTYDAKTPCGFETHNAPRNKAKEAALRREQKKRRHDEAFSSASKKTTKKTSSSSKGPEKDFEQSLKALQSQTDALMDRVDMITSFLGQHPFSFPHHLLPPPPPPTTSAWPSGLLPLNRLNQSNGNSNPNTQKPTPMEALPKKPPKKSKKTKKTVSKEDEEEDEEESSSCSSSSEDDEEKEQPKRKRMKRTTNAL